METNWWIVLSIVALVVLLVIFIIIRNNKDKDEWIQSLNESERSMEQHDEELKHDKAE